MVNAWSKRLLYEIRVLIREHADKYQHELTIGQVRLLGFALREMGMSMADTAEMADHLTGTPFGDEVEFEEDLAALADPRTVRMELQDLLERPNYTMRENEDRRWNPRVVEGAAKKNPPHSDE